MIEIELTDDLKRMAATIWMRRAKTAEARNARLVAALKAARQLVNDCSGVSEDMDSQVQEMLCQIDAAITENEK